MSLGISAYPPLWLYSHIIVRWTMILKLCRYITQETLYTIISRPNARYCLGKMSERNTNCICSTFQQSRLAVSTDYSKNLYWFLKSAVLQQGSTASRLHHFCPPLTRDRGRLCLSANLDVKRSPQYGFIRYAGVTGKAHSVLWLVCRLHVWVSISSRCWHIRLPPLPHRLCGQPSPLSSGYCDLISRW
jgi:hypothetical protein